MKLAVLAIAMAIAPAAAHAEPAYLTCTFERGTVEITADEANSRVTVFQPASGKTFPFNASFGPDEVRFEDGTLAYVINRTDLSIRRLIKMLNKSDAGTCEVKKAPKRAF